MTPAFPGQPLSIRADEWNAVRRVASVADGFVAGRTTGGYTPAEIVLVKNTTAGTIARFAPVGISTRLSVSIDNPPALNGVAVSSSSAVSFGVCQEPIPAGSVGRVALGGVFLARVATTAGAGPAEAGIATATSANLTAAGTELRVKLLHTDPISPDPQSSPPSNTGVFWVKPLGGLVSLGTLFAVRLTQTGGSNGTSTTAPTYTYTIDDINDVELAGVAQSPELTRPNGAVTAATRGMAYRNSAGDIVLFYAHERPQSETCTT